MAKYKGLNVEISPREIQRLSEIGEKHYKLRHLRLSQRVHLAITEAIEKWNQDLDSATKGALYRLVRSFVSLPVVNPY
jgi:hypothetical protein